MYADDIMSSAGKKDEMRSMMKRLEGFLDRKEQVLNAEKIKIMRFRKGGKQRKEIGDKKNKRSKKIKIFRIHPFSLKLLLRKG